MKKIAPGATHAGHWSAVDTAFLVTPDHAMFRNASTNISRLFREGKKVSDTNRVQMFVKPMA